MQSPIHDTLILGGGLAGLSCAARLVDRGRDVVLLEERGRAGGVVGTRRVSGFLFEEGPHTVPGSASTLREVCAELGILERRIASEDAAKMRWIFHAGRLREVPASPKALLTSGLFSAGARLRLARAALFGVKPLPAGAGEVSLAKFLEHEIGPEPTRLLAAAFVRGVYAGELARLGAQSAFPKLWQAAASHGGLLRGAIAMEREQRNAAPAAGPQWPRGALVSFPSGFQELIDAFRAKLGPRIECGRRAVALERSPEGWSVRCADESTWRAHSLVLATPAPAAAALLGPWLSEASRNALESIEHVDLVLVHLGFTANAFPPPQGFGFLVPPGEANAPTMLGTIFSSNLFAGRAPPGCFAATCIYRKGDVPVSGEAEILKHASADLATALGLVRMGPLLAGAVSECREVIPQYTIGHAQRMELLERELAQAAPSVLLCGSYLGGVSVVDVLQRARATAERSFLADGARDAASPGATP
jgi:oxygen-dependent protoporphyrinogen oxidase